MPGEFYAQVCVSEILRECCRDDIVFDAGLRPAEKVDIPDDPGHAKLVLVFHVASVTPFRPSVR